MSAQTPPNLDCARLEGGFSTRPDYGFCEDGRVGKPALRSCAQSRLTAGIRERCVVELCCEIASLPTRHATPFREFIAAKAAALKTNTWDIGPTLASSNTRFPDESHLSFDEQHRAPGQKAHAKTQAAPADRGIVRIKARRRQHDQISADLRCIPDDLAHAVSV